MIEQDVRNLINTGYFFDVRVLESLWLMACDRFRSRAKPRSKITIEGEKRFKTSVCGGNVPRRWGQSGMSARRTNSPEDAGFVSRRRLSDVSTTEVGLDKDTARRSSKFKVQWGERVFIKAIKFTGNKAISDQRLCKC